MTVEQPRQRRKKALDRYVHDLRAQGLSGHAYLATQDIVEPQTAEKALEGPYAQQWQKVIDAELQAMKENDVFEVVQLPKDRKAIGCKFVFKVKHFETQCRWKCAKIRARLVAKGYS